MPTPVYDESKIKTLSSLEHIRARLSMYIGRAGDGSDYEDGIYILVKEVLDNAIDEYIMGFGRKVDIKIDLEEGRVQIRDFGRGIPLGKVVDCVSRINTGAKYNDDVFQFSAGLNGVGTKAVNALSSFFFVRSHRDGKFASATFRQGILVKQEEGDTTERNGTYVEFVPDPEIFPGYKFREDFLLRRLRFYAYLNSSLAIHYNGQSIRAENGLLDLMADEVQSDKVYTPLHYVDKMLEFAFTHTNRFSEEYYTFVNGQFTSDGGTHLSAFREGLLKGVNEYSPKSKFEPDDVREGLVGTIAIRLKDPKFEGQTKTKLGNAEIRSDLVAKVKQCVVELLNRNKPEADKLVAKIEDTQKLRKELNTVKKAARDRAKATTFRIRQLTESKNHYDRARGKGEDTAIFICEGRSAAGSIKHARDAEHQAVFELRGKPLNSCGKRLDFVYKNEELYNLMRALDIGDTVDHLRYRKVILATDADVDGLHIRNLLITYFIRFFDRLVKEGFLYILETPLFRVRPANPKADKRQFYCYNESERLAAIEACGKNPEITRFKGLGEVSPDEFKRFIGDDMRLTPVDMNRDSHINETISFYMGENSPERRKYIMDNLVVDVENLT